MKTNDIIKLTELKKVLVSLEADEATIQLLTNTAKLYNSLIDKMNKGEKVHHYLIMGLNGQLFNQLLGLKKLKQKEGNVNDDPFNNFINTHKKKVEVRN